MRFLKPTLDYNHNPWTTCLGAEGRPRPRAREAHEQVQVRREADFSLGLSQVKSISHQVYLVPAPRHVYIWSQTRDIGLFCTRMQAFSA